LKKYEIIYDVSFQCNSLVNLLSNVRFGSQADICSAKRHVRFAPNSDRDSGLALTVMSALPLKADMCGAPGHVG